MPIHFKDRDVLREIEGINSALIVPCYMCPAVTVAERENRPFIQLFRHLLKSAPFDRYLKALQSRLSENGVTSTVFKSALCHEWFMCMWGSSKREKLRKRMKGYDAVIVLGCESATETVREAAEANGCKVIEGMEVAGIMNARLKFQLPCNVTFEGCEVVPIAQHGKDEHISC